MSGTPQYRRLLWVKCLLCAALGLLGFRLADLQVLRHEELGRTAEKNTRSAILKPAMRGQIRDTRGNVLATSVPTKAVCADPNLISGRQAEVARALAPLLQTNETYILDRLTPRTRLADGRVVTNSYVVLKRRVPAETWLAIHSVMTNLVLSAPGQKLTRAQTNLLAAIRRKGVFAEDDQIRVYPTGMLAAHVVGFVTNTVSRTDGVPHAGAAGIEAFFNPQLTGVSGWRQTEVDTHQRELVPYRDQDVEPVDGLNVVLTLDSGLQYIVESELAEAMREHEPASISCTVVRPSTGEILAMASLPSFDPNTPGAFPAACLRNRVISDYAEPGSTFKIVVISAALNEGVVRPADLVDCGNGLMYYAGLPLHDHGSHGILTVEGIITKSSNIGAAKVGIQLGENRLYQYILDFGFHEKTGLPLPDEVFGAVPRLKDWRKISIARIPMGQGIAVSQLQMVMAMSAIANHGRLMRPMLVSRLESADGAVRARYEPQFVRQVVSEATAREMVEALKTVVGPDGTAATARLENYTVAGKTGTAQKVKMESYTEAGKNGAPPKIKFHSTGYYADKYYSSFIGFFPADNPDICVSVVMDDPKGAHFGSQVAAPAFKRIARRAANYLNIPPDVQPLPRAGGRLAAVQTRAEAPVFAARLNH